MQQNFMLFHPLISFFMKKFIIPIIVFAITNALILSLSSCQTKNYEIDPSFGKYISAFTYGNISPDSYIQIELAEDMPAVELNSEVQDRLFSFSPSIKGKAYWVRSNTIRFIPENGALRPGKSYNGEFHLNKIMKVDKKNKNFKFPFKVSEQNFRIDVKPFSPTNVNDLKWNSAEVVVHLSNSADAQKVEEMFEKSTLPNKAKVEVTQVNDLTYRVLIDGFERTEKAETYQLKVNGKPIGVNKTRKVNIEIPPIENPNRFNVFNVQLVQESSPYIQITFNNPLDQSQDIKGLITTATYMNFTYQKDKNNIKIYPEKLTDGKIILTVHSGIKDNAGTSLSKDYTYELSMEGEKPEIKFEKSGNILPNTNQLYLPFKAVNLWAVDVKIIKIYQSNILYYLQSNTLTDNKSQNELRRFGRLVMKKRIRLDTDKSLTLSQWNNFSIDLSTLFKKDPGAIYLVQLSMDKEYSLYSCNGSKVTVPDKDKLSKFSDEEISDEEMAKWDKTSSYYYDDDYDWEGYSWSDRDDPCTDSYYTYRRNDTKTMVMASNIGIIAKGSSDNKMTVVATDILTTEPLSGATVNVYNYQMQVIGSAKTDGNGFAEIEYQKSKPYVVTLAKGSDIGYLEVKDELSLSLSNFDVSGKEIEKGIKGYVYGERGVWRPGDTIHLSFILDDKMHKLPKDHPVTLEVYTPRRQFYTRQVKTEGQNGFYVFDIPTQTSAETGTWQAYVKVGGTSFYKGLSIETIKPNRLKVRLETDTIIQADKGKITGTLTAQWLQGTPASNMKAQVELTLSKANSPFKGYSGYIFNNPLINFESTTSEIFSGTLNGNGNATVNSPIPNADVAPGMLRGKILSQVFEPGGDMSFYTQTVLYSPYSTYVGIKSPETRQNEFLETDKPLEFNVVTVNSKGQKVAKSGIEYKVYKLDWMWWWNSNSEDLGSYVNNTSVSPISKGVVPMTNGTGKFSFQIKYPDWGRYLVLAVDKGGHTTGTIVYVDWPVWRGRSNKTDPNGLTMLSFSTDKETYSVGEKATVFIPKSSNGRVLISIENGSGILKKEWVKTSAKEDTKYQFEITEEMNPNVYVFATLLQPHAQKDNDLPIRMYGVVNINIENKDSRLNPIISMPNELRPEKEFSVKVSEKSGKPMTYTLAVVDEGLLDLTAFKTPNAWNEFYSKEALGVKTWDLFDRVLSANTGLMGPLLSIGGDEELKSSSDRVNRFKPVVKFIGPFTIGKGGNKIHHIKLPAYIGSVRVMVVAGGDGAYGSAEKTVPVRNALMTLSTLPRVLGPNEEVYLPVNVFAIDKKVKNVSVSVKTTGLMKAVDGSTQNVTFDKPGDKTIYFKYAVGKKIGEEKITITSTGGGESFIETINIGVRNPNPPVIMSKSVLIDPGKAGRLDAEFSNIQSNDWAKLSLSRLPSFDFSKNMSYLLEYPHGCSEQVTSSGFPLLYIDDLMKMTDEDKTKANDKIAQVIQILSSRQTSDGGFAYWPGDYYATQWVTTYAGHFLTEAKNKGYDVPDNVYSRWVQFQEKTARNWSPSGDYRGYYYYSMSDLQQAYRLYTLALSGNADLGAMNRLKEVKNLSQQAKYQLAAAYATAGKKDIAQNLIFNVDNVVTPYSFNNDTYGSSGRDEAMIMDTYLILGQTDKAFTLAQSVAKDLSEYYITTQTASFGLMAMSKLAKKMGKGNIDVVWSLTGKNKGRVNTPQPIWETSITPTSSLYVNITNNGSAKVYATLTARTQPMEESKEPVTNASYRMSVTYVDNSGKPLEPSSIKQGTDFTAYVTIQNEPVTSFTDMALVQIFPSGWEIYNDRLMDGNSGSEKNYSYRDIRDDRVLTYFNISDGQTKSFSVRLRAAYKGTFYLPAVSCQPMYDPSQQARTAGMWVKVE